MSNDRDVRKAWHPQTKEDRDAVLCEMQEILASQHFSNSKRYPALLKYVVEATLAGKSDILKERTLGIEVFDRPASYDTNSDTVVRYTAGEVRKRLQLYYSDHGKDANIHISLPAGSYIPEFFQAAQELEVSADEPDLAQSKLADTGVGEYATNGLSDTVPTPSSASPKFTFHTVSRTGVDARSQFMRRNRGFGHLSSLALSTVVAIVILGCLVWRYWPVNPQTAADDFWRPILHEQSTVLICTGGADVSPNDPMGVKSADRNTEYPLVSFQAASSIALLSSLIQRGGATVQLRFAASTPLTELREYPLVLLTGYNNPWTMRFLEPLRFHFEPEPKYGIVDQTQPQLRWARDPSVPYSSADDYALVARFWNTTTDSWVLVLAGVGRNGMEGAAQFVADPHYLQLLRDQIGRDFSNQNVEVVLKVGVIEGKTGAPSIEAVHVW